MRSLNVELTLGEEIDNMIVAVISRSKGSKVTDVLESLIIMHKNQSLLMADLEEKNNKFMTAGTHTILTGAKRSRDMALAGQLAYDWLYMASWFLRTAIYNTLQWEVVSNKKPKFLHDYNRSMWELGNLANYHASSLVSIQALTDVLAILKECEPVKFEIRTVADIVALPNSIRHNSLVSRMSVNKAFR